MAGECFLSLGAAFWCLDHVGPSERIDTMARHLWTEGVSFRFESPIGILKSPDLAKEWTPWCGTCGRGVFSFSSSGLGTLLHANLAKYSSIVGHFPSLQKTTHHLLINKGNTGIQSSWGGGLHYLAKHPIGKNGFVLNSVWGRHLFVAFEASNPKGMPSHSLP